MSRYTDRRRDVVAQLRAAGCVFAEDEARILEDAATGAAELDSMIARRVAGEPLEQIVGWAEFDGLRILVAPGVFVPRRRSEALVREAVARCKAGDVVVDMCCGSGAVGAAIAARSPGLELYASDNDPAAVACARRNLDGVGEALVGDLYAALPPDLRGRVAVVVANAPYVPSEEVALMPREARDHEPRATLDGGADGVDVHRRMAAEAPRWLAPGGFLLIETSELQADATARAMSGAGLETTVARHDDVAGTVVVGRRSVARL